MALKTSFNYYSAVQKIMGGMTQPMMQQYAICRTERERMEFVLNFEMVHEHMKVEPMKIKKSTKESNTCREKGNHFYQKEKHEEALKEYNKAVLYAPMPSADMQDKNLALAFGNRSAVLYHMKYYSQALHDVERALQINYPKDLRFKLEDRKGKCLLKLNKLKEAKKAFIDAKDLLKYSKSEDEKAVWQDVIEKELEMTNMPKGKLHRSKSIQKDFALPVIKDETNHVFHAASEAFNVCYDVEKGRFGVAQKDIEVGDVIVCEPPYVGVVSTSHYGQYCYHCFSKMVAPVGCRLCMSASYCSEACRKESWMAYHNYECDYINVLDNCEVGNIAKLCLRIILVAGINKLKACRDLKAHRKRYSGAPVDGHGVFLGGMEALYELMSHRDHRHLHESFQYALLSVFLFKILERVNFFTSESETDKTFIAGCLLHFNQIIACNGVDIMEAILTKDVTKLDMKSIGMGLYPTISFINHSCHPTMELIFYHGTCAVRALRTVRHGEEITIDYGFVYYLNSKEQRQASLESQYFFECKCEACEGKWGLKSTLPSSIPIFTCLQCKNPMSFFLTGSVETLDPSKIRCNYCGHSQNILHCHSESLKKVNDNLELGNSLARNGSVLEAIPILEGVIKSLDDHIKLPWKDYAICFSLLRQCYRTEGNAVTSSCVH